MKSKKISLNQTQGFNIACEDQPERTHPPQDENNTRNKILSLNNLESADGNNTWNKILGLNNFDSADGNIVFFASDNQGKTWPVKDDEPTDWRLSFLKKNPLFEDYIRDLKRNIFTSSFKDFQSFDSYLHNPLSNDSMYNGLRKKEKKKHIYQNPLESKFFYQFHPSAFNSKYQGIIDPNTISKIIKIYHIESERNRCSQLLVENQETRNIKKYIFSRSIDIEESSLKQYLSNALMMVEQFCIQTKEKYLFRLREKLEKEYKTYLDIIGEVFYLEDLKPINLILARITEIKEDCDTINQMFNDLYNCEVFRVYYERVKHLFPNLQSRFEHVQKEYNTKKQQYTNNIVKKRFVEDVKPKEKELKSQLEIFKTIFSKEERKNIFQEGSFFRIQNIEKLRAKTERFLLPKNFISDQEQQLDELLLQIEVTTKRLSLLSYKKKTL